MATCYQGILPSISVKTMLRILDVPTLSAISLEKVHPHGRSALYLVFMPRFCL